MSIVARCRRRGRAFAADRAAIDAGAWRSCPACRPPAPTPGPEGSCEGCGRLLRASNRTVCARWLGIAA